MAIDRDFDKIAPLIVDSASDDPAGSHPPGESGTGGGLAERIATSRRRDALVLAAPSPSPSPSSGARRPTPRREPGRARHRRRVHGSVVAVAALAVLAGACSSSSTSGSATTATASSCASSAPGGKLSRACATISPTATLNGAGSNSTGPFFQATFTKYHDANPAVTVHYSASGSAVGLSDIKSGTVAFGQSEVPIPFPPLGAHGNILQLPVTLGGVAISYNLPQLNHVLDLTGDQLAQIYLGRITDWHEIDASIPSGTRITAVHRADPSGPSYYLDQYLIDTSPTWRSAIGTDKASTQWPVPAVGVGEQLNSGVASFIARTPGSVGFVAYAYAKANNLVDAAVQNASGAFVAPSISTIEAAGAGVAHLSAMNFDIVNGTGTAYPLANYSWTMLYQKQTDTNQGIALGKLFLWVVTAGQKEAPGLGYAKLPRDARFLAHLTLRDLETASGTPLFTS